MSSFSFSYPYTINGALIAYFEGRVRMGQVRGEFDYADIEVELEGSRECVVMMVDAPEPLRSDIIKWLETNDADRFNEAIDNARAGTMGYDRHQGRGE